MEIKNLRVFVKEKIEAYPELEKDIKSLYHLCLAEIAEGDDEKHQVNLCWFDIEELIEDYLEENK